MRKLIYKKTTKNAKNKVDPNNPNSSAKIAKIKSVYIKGKYCNFCIERPKPCPKRPPEPMANKLWTNWNPVSCWSFQGSINDITLSFWY